MSACANDVINKLPASNILEKIICIFFMFQDSVAAVDGEDKTIVYRNWLGLMKGDLKESFAKNGTQMTRELSSNFIWSKYES